MAGNAFSGSTAGCDITDNVSKIGIESIGILYEAIKIIIRTDSWLPGDRPFSFVVLLYLRVFSEYVSNTIFFICRAFF